MRGLVINYSGQKLRLRSEQRGNPSDHWTASWAGSVYPTPRSVRRDRRSKRLPRTGLQTICRKISQTLCRQRLSVEGSHEGEYPCTKEPPGLIRTDGKRPDGATLVPWAREKYISWDFTAIHTYAASYLHLSSSIPGGVAEHAADRKRNKYATLPASHEFVPIAVEILDTINREGCKFLLELGRRGAGVSGDPRETVFLFQRLSVCIQRFNTLAYRGTFSTHHPDEEVLT